MYVCKVNYSKSAHLDDYTACLFKIVNTWVQTYVCMYVCTPFALNWYTTHTGYSTLLVYFKMLFHYLASVQ